MSFGDPNNPYGPPSQQQPPAAPDYGYPQQTPQQPYSSYPAAPPIAQPYGGYPGTPMTTMPSTVSAARVMLWVIVGLQVIGLLLYAIGAVAVNAAKDSTDDPAVAEALGDLPVGTMWAIAAFSVAWMVYAIILAVKFNTGGSGVRIAALVFGIITAILGIYPFLVIGLVHVVLGVLIAVFVGNSAGSAWFKRPRY